jgi:hypothetical protein
MQVGINANFIPPDQVCVEDLAEWEHAKEELERVKTLENVLRMKIFRGLFPGAREGTNNVRLPTGDLIKADNKINRSVDQERLDHLKQYKVGDMREWLTSLGIDVAGLNPDTPVIEVLKLRLDQLIEYKPGLVTKEYRTLTKEQQAVFDSVLDIKPGTPQLSITKAS